MAISPATPDRPDPAHAAGGDAPRAFSLRRRTPRQRVGEPWWGPGMARGHVGASLLAVGVAVLCGVVLGLVWQAAAPSVVGVVGSLGAAPDETQAGRIFAGEGVFAVLTVVAGVAAAELGRGWVRSAGPIAVVAIAVATLLGAVVAWRVGVWAGPDALEVAGMDPGRLEDLGGQTVALPLVLRSHGLLLFAPIAATFVTMWLAVVTLDTGTSRSAGESESEVSPSLGQPASGTSRSEGQPAATPRSP